jgi:hypothetical protein
LGAEGRQFESGIPDHFYVFFGVLGGLMASEAKTGNPKQAFAGVLQGF